MVFSKIIKAFGVLKTLAFELFKDAGLTIPYDTQDWGTVSPGESKEVKSWIRNTCRFPLTIALVTGDWTPPEAENFITLKWDYNGTNIQVGEVRAITFTLTIAESVSGITDFGFNITITAEG